MVIKVFCIVLFLFSCGREKKHESKIPDEVKKASWDEIKADVEAECIRCHNGQKHPLNFWQEEAFKNSKAEARITNASMPPDKVLPSETKERLLSYF